LRLDETERSIYAGHLLCDLAWIMHDDLRLSSVELDFARRADALSLQCHIRLPEFRPVTSENNDRKGLIWIGLIDVKERRLRPRCRCIFGGSNNAVDGGILADMARSLGCGERRSIGRRCQEQSYGPDK